MGKRGKKANWRKKPSYRRDRRRTLFRNAISTIPSGEADVFGRQALLECLSPSPLVFFQPMSNDVSFNCWEGFDDIRFEDDGDDEIVTSKVIPRKKLGSEKKKKKRKEMMNLFMTMCTMM